MSLAIILGDVHLGKAQSIGKTSVGANINTKLSDQLNLLNWTLEQAVDNHASNIIITGDVFEDPKPHPTVITSFIAWLKKCQAYNVAVHIVAGNHDVFRSGFVYSSPLDIILEADLENIFIYKDINTICIGLTSFTLMPFRDRKSFGVSSNSEALKILQDSITYELASIPATYNKVVIGHLAIEGSIPIGDEIDDTTNELFCSTDMFNGYDYVWMGHVHKPQVLKKKPHIAHIGSMDVSNFGETDHKKIIVLFDCDSGSFSTNQLPTRNLKKITINIPKETADSTAYVISEIEKHKDTLNKSVVKVDISISDVETKSIDKSKIEKILSEYGAFNIAGISESKKINVLKKDSEKNIDTKMDIVSAIKMYSSVYIEEDNREQFSSLALDIYNAYKSEVKE